MKKLLLAALLLPLVSQAGDRVVLVTNPNNHPSAQRHGVVFVKTFCEFGMQFMTTVQDKDRTGAGSGGVSTIQVIRPDGKPMECQQTGK